MSRNGIVFAFSGQGSFLPGMGRNLLEHQSTFRHWMLQLDSFARSSCGIRVVEHLYGRGDSGNGVAATTTFTYAAIFMVEYASAMTVIERGITPNFVLGVSMGAFAAAAVAGCVEPQFALASAIAQASAIERYCQPGGMISVLCPNAAQVCRALPEDLYEIGAYNSTSHIVLATRRELLEFLEMQLRARQCAVQRLAVSYAFHSRWIEDAAAPYLRFLHGRPYGRPRIPIVCCAHAGALNSIPEDYFWTVTRRPIRFDETIVNLETAGSYLYIDVGPSGTVATLLKHVLPAGSRSHAIQVLNPFAPKGDLRTVELQVQKLLGREHEDNGDCAVYPRVARSR